MLTIRFAGYFSNIFANVDSLQRNMDGYLAHLSVCRMMSLFFVIAAFSSFAERVESKLFIICHTLPVLARKRCPYFSSLLPLLRFLKESNRNSSSFAPFFPSFFTELVGRSHNTHTKCQTLIQEASYKCYCSYCIVLTKLKNKTDRNAVSIQPEVGSETE